MFLVFFLGFAALDFGFSLAFRLAFAFFEALFLEFVESELSLV
jgi:hypothetical protein